MATALDQAFIMAVNAAESVRQGSKASALATYVAAGFTPAARTTYAAALVTADTAYINPPFNTAAGTAGVTLNSGYSGLIGGYIGTVST